jgi:hypothetical protein
MPNAQRFGARRGRPNASRVKILLTYTVHETARTLGVHKNTVRAWLKQGLPTIDRQRPRLILGSSLAEFLRNRRSKPKVVCGPGEFYCVRCRAPRRPALGMADYLPVSLLSGNLRGICPECQTLIHRRVSLAKIQVLEAILEITFPQDHPRIGEPSSPCVECDSPTIERDDAKAQPC